MSNMAKNMTLFDNGGEAEYGFSVDSSNPFRVFPLLQKVARESMASGTDVGVVDLSRGDPGYGAAPSARGREFLSFLLFLDTKLNNTRQLFIDTDRGQEKRILEDIATYTRSTYVPALAERLLKDLSEFVQRASMICREQGLAWDTYDVLREIFKCSTVSGGTYHDPQGEKLVRAIIAWWHGQTLTTPVNYEDVVFTAGASHGIGTLFKLLGQEGLQFLTPGDKVLISSPVYAPYNTIMERRGIEVIGLPVDPFTGKVEKEGLDMLKKLKDVKAVLIIDPNNPTGFAMDEATLEVLANFAKKQDALVISDEVYSSFFKEERTILDLCPERTVRIQARSKIERSTGLRFGDVVISKQANEYLTKYLLRGKLPEGRDFRTAFVFAKGPGGIHGEFQHTTFVAGPAQFLGAAHILLGGEERDAYREWMQTNMRIFCEKLGLPHEGNGYYVMFDMNEVPGCTKQDVAPEEKIHELAKRGVVLLPANLFFSEADRARKDRRHTVRASLANASPEKVKAAAEVVRNYLTS
jgi:aspartate/methionine/tyrosine aminotransferase